MDRRMPWSGMNTPPRFDNWRRPRQMRWYRSNKPGPQQPPRRGPATPPDQGPVGPQQGTPGFEGFPGGFEPGGLPGVPQNVPNFLPATPEFEAGQRGASDQLSATLAQIGITRQQLPYILAQANARATTDKGYANAGLDEQLASRGIFQGGSNAYLRNRDIDLPFGRASQDRTAAYQQQLADLANQESQANLAYQQQIAELLLDRASQVAMNPSYAVPQYSPNRLRRGRNR